MPALRFSREPLPKGAVQPGVWSRLRDLRDRPGREPRTTRTEGPLQIVEITVDPATLRARLGAALKEGQQVTILRARRVDLPGAFSEAMTRAASEHGGAVAFDENGVVVVRGVRLAP